MKLQENVLKRNSMRFAAALLAALAGFIGGPNAALAAAPPHHDQAPGFYRLKVGDLEVPAGESASRLDNRKKLLEQLDDLANDLGEVERAKERRPREPASTDTGK